MIFRYLTSLEFMRLIQVFGYDVFTDLRGFRAYKRFDQRFEIFAIYQKKNQGKNFFTSNKCEKN